MEVTNNHKKKEIKKKEKEIYVPLIYWYHGFSDQFFNQLNIMIINEQLSKRLYPLYKELINNQDKNLKYILN